MTNFLLYFLLIIKKQVNCLEYCSSTNLLICGSEDSRISFWVLNEVFFYTITEYCYPDFIIYGHHSKIIAMAKNSILGVLVSADMV